MWSISFKYTAIIHTWSIFSEHQSRSATHCASYIKSEQFFSGKSKRKSFINSRKLDKYMNFRWCMNCLRCFCCVCVCVFRFVLLERAHMIDYNIWRFLCVDFGHRSSCGAYNCSLPLSSASHLCIWWAISAKWVHYVIHESTETPKIGWYYQKINDIFHLRVCWNVVRAHNSLLSLPKKRAKKTTTAQHLWPHK